MEDMVLQLSYIYPKMFRESEGGLNAGFLNWFLIDYYKVEH